MEITIVQLLGYGAGMLGVILTILNIIDKANTLKKLEEAPFNELKSRVDGQDVEIKDIKMAMKMGNDKFRYLEERFKKQDSLDEVFINCMLAFIDFEMAYCSSTGYKDTEDLENAKNTLRKYLSKREL